MYFYVYKIINKLNGKFYIGAHLTKNLNDGYMGSGVNIRRAIKKYGIENFEKEILKFFSNIDDMYEYEKGLVTEDFCKSELVYNMAPGGSGGSIIVNRKPFTSKHTIDTKEKIAKHRIGKTHSTETKIKISNNSWSKLDPVAQRIHAQNAPSKIRDEVTKNKISKGMEGKINNPNGRTINKVKCPSCGKEGSEMAMKRWHFENCRN